MESEFLKKSPKQSRSRAVVGALVSALEQLLDKSEDVSGISVQRVAERAGVGIGSLYDYFKSREGLFGEFLARLTDDNFIKMRDAVESTNHGTLGLALERVVDATLETYLTKPNRTRAAILTIFRLGWIDPVIRERDRFAEVLVTRILHSHPGLDRARVESVCRLLCDAVMGVVMTEVWRPRPDVRDQLVRLAGGLMERELGIDLDAPAHSS